MRLVLLGLVAAVLFVALGEINFRSLSIPEFPMGGPMIAIALWVIGRMAWKRKTKPIRTERPRPRRRALPPAPEGEVYR